jgi:hypothetical protein
MLVRKKGGVLREKRKLTGVTLLEDVEVLKTRRLRVGFFRSPLHILKDTRDENWV